MTSGKRVAGVLGWPVSHSLSPKLHNYWLNRHAIDGAYIPMAVKPEDLSDVVRALPKMGIVGFNVTVPHKETIMPWLGGIDDEAKKIGAVNMVVVDNGKLRGRNTDAYGFAENIRSQLKHKRTAMVLGAGGAARGVVHALAGLGFSRILVANRTPAKAASLIKGVMGAEIAAWDKRATLLENVDLLVNTTSLGLAGGEPLDLDLAALPKEALVTDIVYKPLLTPLLERARERGNPIVDGLGMLMHQAVPAFEAWFGVRPEVTADLRKHLLHD